MIKGGGAAQINWPQQQRAKQEVTDVKTELAKLNTSEYQFIHKITTDRYIINMHFVIAYVYQNDWPANNVKLGAVTAVSFDRAANVVIFHRVNRIWNQRTFDMANVYQERNKGPIKENTVLGLEPNTGNVLYAWGKNL